MLLIFFAKFLIYDLPLDTVLGLIKNEAKE